MGWLLCSPARAGSFEIDGGQLRFGPMVSTRMACPDGMDVERQFLETLAQVERYRIFGSFLEFLNGSDTMMPGLKQKAFDRRVDDSGRILKQSTMFK
ncbi:MAG: META domain-containing protein [Desulfotignum sp.]|nr:META domain-containing protein [Desulfotignum sp.]